MIQLIYKKILLTHDGSKLSSAAIPHALVLATAFDADILLIHVVHTIDQEIVNLEPSGTAYLNGSLAKTASNIVAWDKQKAEKQLQKIKQQFDVSGKKNVKVMVVEGIAERVIVEVAKKQKCDLVVMSTHGRSGLGRAVLGSVADYVVRHVDCPVLLLHPKKE
jgi:nucleotide-binding universal stress UspA family protein